MPGSCDNIHKRLTQVRAILPENLYSAPGLFPRTSYVRDIEPILDKLDVHAQRTSIVDRAWFTEQG